MRTRTAIVLALVVGLVGGALGTMVLGRTGGSPLIASGSAGQAATPQSHPGIRNSSSRKPLVEGPIWSVAYDSANDPGEIAGFTTAGHAEAVPGGHRSWIVHRYGKLYPDFLGITAPSEKDRGVWAIPVDRFRKIHFLDE